MKKIISLLTAAAVVAVFNFSAFGKPSVGYVLVGPKKRWWLVYATLPGI